MIYRVRQLVLEPIPAAFPIPPHHQVLGGADLAFMFPTLRERDREEFWTVYLDAKFLLSGLECVAVGTLTTATVHPREVFKGAILANAARIALIHNHPSGDPEPSREDNRLTERLRSAGDLLHIPVLDHVIVGQTAYFSFNDGVSE